MADNFVQNIYEKLFGRNSSEKSIEILDGPLERSDSYNEAFELWKASTKAEEILQSISNVFWNVRRDIAYSPGLFSFSSPQANGFYFNTKLGISELGFSFLFDDFRDNVIKMGYSLYTSDKKYVEVPAGIQRVDKHYLKPMNTSEQSKLYDQKYGNVLFELYSLNEEAQYLKCMVTVYSDRKFAEALPFEQFAEKLFKSS